jgi:hypothetical protein
VSAVPRLLLIAFLAHVKAGLRSAARSDGELAGPDHASEIASDADSTVAARSNHRANVVGSVHASMRARSSSETHSSRSSRSCNGASA